MNVIIPSHLLLSNVCIFLASLFTITASFFSGLSFNLETVEAKGLYENVKPTNWIFVRIL